jgi:hypothetical protein
MVISSASPSSLAVDYSPEYASEAMCKEARLGAIEFGSPSTELCTDDPFVIDAQWYQRMRWEIESGIWYIQQG